MSLRELTQERHRRAEQTPFMKAVFARSLPSNLWADFLHQKWYWYAAIEDIADQFHVLDSVPEIRRAKLIKQDYLNMVIPIRRTHQRHPLTKDYALYVLGLDDPRKILAHVYVWHFGDLYGGQMIKKMISAPHAHLDFDDPQSLIAKTRLLLSDDMADEANLAFDNAIKILNSYEL
jgi:hypothetical protein